MTRDERNNWIMNIENTASFIASEVGSETVKFVLEKYGVAWSCIHRTDCNI